MTQKTAAARLAILLGSAFVAVFAIHSAQADTFTAGPNCSLSSPAFCETFAAAASPRGRGGDINSTTLAFVRLSGEMQSTGAGVANPVPPAPMLPCRADVASPAFPPNDVRVCDDHALMVAVSMQNYGVGSLMARQPIDLSNGVRRIVFDSDAVDYGAAFVTIEVTPTPEQAVSFRAANNFEAQPALADGFTTRLSHFAECPNGVAPDPADTMVYVAHVGTPLVPTFNHGAGCAATSPGKLGHFEIQISLSDVKVLGSDFSTDGGLTFPNFRLLYSANFPQPLSFSTAYVHLSFRNHATFKYGQGTCTINAAGQTICPDVVYRLRNFGFDGVVLPTPRAYEIADNTTTAAASYGGQAPGPYQNLGWQLLNGVDKGSAGPGIYDPTPCADGSLCNKVNSLTFPNVDLTGAMSARLTMNAFVNAIDGANSSWGLQYRFNGGAWRQHNLSTADLACINVFGPSLPLGILALTLDVPLGDLIQGTNTLNMMPLGPVPMDFQPAFANVDLDIELASGSPLPLPLPPPLPSPPPPGLAVGQPVQAPSTATILGCAGPGTQASGSQGTIVAGPVQFGGATWWQVRWADRSTSWATADELAASTPAPSPPPPAPPPPTPPPSPPPPPPSPPPVLAGNCGSQLGGPVAFCERFSAPAGTGTRAGQLGPIWGVSRGTGDNNFGASYAVPWGKATIVACDGTEQPAPPDSGDIIVCKNQMREAVNDNSTVTVFAMYPKQPIDLTALRTISFDVSDDSEGTHDWWPELVITDRPTPTPFLHFEDVGGRAPPNAFGVRFAASAAANQTAGLAPNCPNDNNRRFTVDSAFAVRGGVIDDSTGFGVRSAMNVTPIGCVISSSGPTGGLNHIEVQIDPVKNQADVFGTDAGTTTPLIHIATISDINLSLKAGLVWIEHTNYNAAKTCEFGAVPNCIDHSNHTVSWANFAFDGRVLPRDLSVDALDSLTTCHDGLPCLGWDAVSVLQPARMSTLPIQAADINAATDQRLMFAAWFETQPSVFSISVNGHSYGFAWPYSYAAPSGSTSTFSFQINKADLVSGPQAITIASDQEIQVSNVNIVLVGAGGLVPPPTP